MTDCCDTKKCSKCGEVKLVSEFVRDKNKPDGYTMQCKHCRKESRNRTMLKRIDANLNIESKKCYKCGEVKPSHMFYKNKYTSDLLSSECKACGLLTKQEIISRRIVSNYKRETKKCWVCGEIKPSSMFNYNKTKTDLLSSECITCTNLQSKLTRIKRKQIAFVAVSRTCPKCNLQKLKTEFHSAAGNIDGLSTYCKNCRGEIRRKKQKKHNCIVCESTFYSVLDKVSHCSNKCATQQWWDSLPIEEKLSKRKNYSKHYYIQNYNKIRAKAQDDVINLKDPYIKALISGSSSLKHSDIPQSLIEAYRLKIQISRLIKQL